MLDRMEIRFVKSTDDRYEISKIYEESWKFAYRGIIPQAYLDSILRGQWASKVDEPDWNTLVCVEDEKIVGTTSFSRSRFEQFSNWGEIISIYLLPAYMKKGFGRALLEAAIFELGKVGYHDIFLWVLEENINARRFYEKVGFTLTSEYLDDKIGGKELREVSYIYHSDIVSENNELIENIDKLHTTKMGLERIRKNLSLSGSDAVEWCRSKILDNEASIVRHGKNWYVKINDCVITVNASSYTIITAHRGEF